MAETFGLRIYHNKIAHIGVSKNRENPKMDGENNGTPY